MRGKRLLANGSSDLRIIGKNDGLQEVRKRIRYY